jgi:PAS domain S-box-containing protein
MGDPSLARAGNTATAVLPALVRSVGLLIHRWHGTLATPAATALAIVLLVTSALLANDKIHGVEAGAALADQVHSSQLATQRLFSTVQDAETGQRGYLLTNDRSYLPPFDAARTRVAVDLAQIEVTPYASPTRAGRIRRVRELVREKMDELGRTVALQRSGNAEAAQAIVRSNLGKQQMDAIRAEVEALQSEDQARLEQIRVLTRSEWAWLVVVSLVALASALLSWTAITERRARTYLATTVVALKRMEAELRDSERLHRVSRERAEHAEALLRDAVESIAEGFVIYDREDRFVMCNDTYRRFYPDRAGALIPGTPIKDILLHELAKVGTGESHPLEADWLEARLRYHRNAENSVERRQAHGIWILATNRRMKNGGIAGLRVDITALKQSQMALGKSEARLDRAQMTACIGSWEVDLISGQEIWSKELYRIRGLSPETFEPNVDSAAPYVHAGDYQSSLSWHANLAAGHEQTARDIRIIRPDGEVRLVRLDGRAVPDPDGVIRGLAGTMQDITEHRLIERQLAQAQKMEAIGNLTGGMAHDFNNGLGVIIGNLSLLERLIKTDPDATELCGEALDGALRCADLIRLLLAFARRQPLDPRQIDVNELVERTVRLLSRTLGADIALAPHYGACLPPVVADPAELEAALTNLANNARDAMPRGGRLDIRTKAAELDPDYAALHLDAKPGTYVLIEVSDTGTGIAPDIINSIFEPFFTTKEQGRGTGLGLSMVYGFARQSGGHVAVYSEPGLGTTFRLYLPPALVGDATGMNAADPPPVVGGDETVLMVEDNAPLRRATERQLTELGYRVREAEDAAAAMTILTSEDRVDLLFTDVVMPGKMDGLDLANAAVESREGLKVLLTSGFPELRGPDPRITDCRFPLLNKPYGRDELARKVREILDQDARRTACRTESISL